nr:hypothetical protein B0A51_02918 [Rachicladosporium sp. CCFEE 5018]
MLEVTKVLFEVGVLVRIGIKMAEASVESPRRKANISDETKTYIPAGGSPTRNAESDLREASQREYGEHVTVSGYVPVDPSTIKISKLNLENPPTQPWTPFFDRKLDYLAPEEVDKRIEEVNAEIDNEDTSPRARVLWLYYKSSMQMYKAFEEPYNVTATVEEGLATYLKRREAMTARAREIELYALDKALIELYSRWGDYLADVFKVMRRRLKDNPECVTDLRTEMLREQDFAETRAKGDPEVYRSTLWRLPLHKDIMDASIGLGGKVNDYTVWADIIKHDTVRNTLLHSRLDELVKTRAWDDLGKRCDEDLKICEGLLDPVTQAKELHICRTTMLAYKEMWVARDGPNERYETHSIITKAKEEGFGNLEDLKLVARAKRDKGEDEARKMIDNFVQRDKDAERMRDAQLLLDKPKDSEEVKLRNKIANLEAAFAALNKKRVEPLERQIEEMLAENKALRQEIEEFKQGKAGQSSEKL